MGRRPQTYPRALLASLLLAAVVAVGGRRTASRVRIGMDGGYSDILVQVSEDLPRASCRTIISNLKVTNISIFQLSLLSWVFVPFQAL
jgi:hypothetical protein